MSYQREYRRARRNLRHTVHIWRRTYPDSPTDYIDLSRHPATVCMAMKMRGHDNNWLYLGLYDAWLQVFRALEKFPRRISTKWPAETPS